MRERLEHAFKKWHTMCLTRMLFLVATVFCLPVWGEDVPGQDIILSQLTTLSAEQGNAAAQYQLAKRYESGRGVERNDAQAVYWLTKSADLGHVDAQLEMSLRYHEGEGVTKDMALSIAWLRRAALQGSTWAQLRLAEILYRGQGIKADQETAVVWYMLAAERGDTTAKFRLAKCYAKGAGVQKNLINAAKWYYVLQLARERKAGEQKAGEQKAPTPQSKPQEQSFAKETDEYAGSMPPESGTSSFLVDGKSGELFFTRIAEDVAQLEKQMTEKDILAAKAMALAWFTR